MHATNALRGRSLANRAGVRKSEVTQRGRRHMDFAWSEEQLAYRDEVIAFAQSTLGDELEARDQNGEFSRAD